MMVLIFLHNSIDVLGPGYRKILLHEVILVSRILSFYSVCYAQSTVII